MSRINQILFAVLVVQALILGIRFAGGDDDGGFERGSLIEGLEKGAVDRIESYGDGEQAVLEKQGDTWVVADAAGYPADQDKVSEVLGELIGLQTVDLVSTTKNHHVDLKVADSDYQRKVVLKSGGRETVIYLGTSGRGGSTHARVGGSDEVFAVSEFSAWKVPSRGQGWLDRIYVEMDKERIMSVEVDGRFRLERTSESAWSVQLPGQPAAVAEQSKVDNILNKLKSVSLTKVAGKHPEAAPSGEVYTVKVGLGSMSAPLQIGEGDEPVANLPVSPVIDETRTLTLAEKPGEEQGNWLLHANGESHVVEVGGWMVGPLVEDDPADLVPGGVEGEE